MNWSHRIPRQKYATRRICVLEPRNIAHMGGGPASLRRLGANRACCKAECTFSALHTVYQVDFLHNKKPPNRGKNILSQFSLFVKGFLRYFSKKSRFFGRWDTEDEKTEVFGRKRLTFGENMVK